MKTKKQFKCQQDRCGKKFTTKAILTQHQLVHQNNKLFKCSECLFETKCLNNLNDHIKIRHTRQDLITQNKI